MHFFFFCSSPPLPRGSINESHRLTKLHSISLIISKSKRCGEAIWTIIAL